MDEAMFVHCDFVDFPSLLSPILSGYRSQTNHFSPGTTPLPPSFAIAYHQCRWNYNDQDDVLTVNSNFDKFDIPVDVIWLDIEHTNGKRYFTWDKQKFPDSVEMINQVAAKVSSIE